MDDVRSLVQGLAPRSLRESGLDAALGELAAGPPVPTELYVDLAGAVDTETAAAAYFVASEAVTNSVRHGSAERITIRIATADGRLDVVVLDDGVGGAVPTPGRGLEGLDARVRASGGELRVVSPRGAGTTVRASLPIGDGR
jgi:signal transduction histidine kinase